MLIYINEFGCGLKMFEVSLSSFIFSLQFTFISPLNPVVCLFRGGFSLVHLTLGLCRSRIHWIGLPLKAFGLCHGPHGFFLNLHISILQKSGHTNSQQVHWQIIYHWYLVSYIALFVIILVLEVPFINPALFDKCPMTIVLTTIVLTRCSGVYLVFCMNPAVLYFITREQNSCFLSMHCKPWHISWLNDFLLAIRSWKMAATPKTTLPPSLLSDSIQETWWTSNLRLRRSGMSLRSRPLEVSFLFLSCLSCFLCSRTFSAHPY